MSAAELPDRPGAPQAPLTSRDEAKRAVARLQTMLAARGLTLRPPPPEPTTCCGRGCDGCVWVAYDDALLLWLEDASARLAPASTPVCRSSSTQ